MKKIIWILLIMTLISACQSSIPAKSCVKAEIEEWSWLELLEAATVGGYVTNNCSTNVRYVILQANGYHASGTLLNQDNDVVWNLEPGGSKYFNVTLWSSKGIIDLCTVEVVEAEH